MSEKRESFVFYRSFYDVISTLDNDDKVDLVDMICELGLNRKKVDPKNKLLNQLFILIRPQIDANYVKAIGGKSGGRPRKKPMVKPMVKPMPKPEGKPNVNENVNANENVNVTESDTRGSYFDTCVDPETGEVYEVPN